MAFTESNMMDLGTLAPDFNLPDTVSGNTVNLQEVKGENGTIIIFLCNHCPYVIHVNEEIVSICNEYAAKGVGSVGISSNDVENYPDDSPEKMKIHAETVKYPFPYLYDEDQSVARSYDAICTPDFFGFNSDMGLQYRGRLDASRKEAGPDNLRRDLYEAMVQVARTGKGPRDQISSMGCSIKWKE